MTASPIGPGGDDPLIGQVLLGRYHIVRPLEARGGTRVYLAERRDVEPAAEVDVDVVGSGEAAAVERFLEDARTIARVGHENVAAIFNGGRLPSGEAFLVREHLPGDDLTRLLAAAGPLLWDRAQGIVLQVAAAVGAAHRHGVVHEGLCLEAVRVDAQEGRRDHVKVLDFGVARLAGGTPAYSAPETRFGRADARADVYSLGALTYALVTGDPPHGLAGGATGAVAVPPTARRPPGTLPPELDGVVVRALAHNPEHRWPDATTFADAIARCRLTRRQSVRIEALAAAERSGKTGAFEADARRRKRARAIGSVVAAVAVAIAVLRVLATSPGHVQISTVPADAEVTFNGLPVPARSPIVLDAAPGHYMLTVARPGYVTSERTIEVPARTTVSVPVTLTAAPAPPPAAVNPAAAAPQATAAPTP